jgi:hypothetical protein
MMNWGYRIVLAFVFFIALMVTLVTISMRQNIDLVAEDYYREEIEYQNQIDRMNRTNSLELEPSVIIDRINKKILLNLKQKEFNSARAVFFRPSDATQDKVIDLFEDGATSVSYSGWESGLWKVKLHWKQAGEEFYIEKKITL